MTIPKLPTLVCNKFHVLVTDGSARVALGEQIAGEEIAYHVAVCMSIENAEALAELITRLIAQHREPPTPMERPSCLN